MKTGTKVYFKPIDFYTVLYTYPDGRVQIQKGKGGATFAVDPEKLRICPAIVDNEELMYWEQKSKDMYNFIVTDNTLSSKSPQTEEDP